MKPSVILALAVACLAAPLSPSGAYKDALDIINRQGSKFSDSSLKKRHSEPDSFNIVFKDGVSIDQISEHLKILDDLIEDDSLNGIKNAFDLPSQRDGSGLMGYSGHFDESIISALGKYSDLVTVEKDTIQSLPSYENFQRTENVFQGGRGRFDQFFDWWKTSFPGRNQPNPRVQPENKFREPVQPNQPVQPQPNQPNQPSRDSSGFQEVPTKNWGSFRVSHRANSRSQNQYAMNTASKNPTVVYVVDSGIRTSHKMFGGRASWGANFADNSNTDFQGHGTHVAGTIGGAEYGVSPSSKLIAVKVFHQMTGSTSQIMRGVSWAIDDFVKNKHRYPRGVINFSGGGGVSDAEDALFKRAVDMGMVVAVAAGNDNMNACSISPARAGASTGGYITVAASSADDSLAFWDARTNKASNWGSCVDVIAPGTNILSADFQSDHGILSNSGTSMATPHVAGLAAQLMATTNELLTPAQVESKIINGNTGRITGALRGTPNKLAYNGSGK